MHETGERRRVAPRIEAADVVGGPVAAAGHHGQQPLDRLQHARHASERERARAEPDDLTIVRSTIDLAHNLGLQVVAEGVETEEAATHLAALGCDMLQGFLLSRPVPAERLAGLIPALAKPRHRAA